MLFQCLCGFKLVFYSTHSDDEPVNYKDFEGAIKDWIKCAFYLGVVFSKTTEDHLSFFLGVDSK